MIIEMYEREYINFEGEWVDQWVVRIDGQQVYGCPEKPTTEQVKALVGHMNNWYAKKRMGLDKTQSNPG